MDKSATSKKYAAGTAVVVLLTLYIDHIYFSSDKSTVNKVLPIEQQVAQVVEQETSVTLASQVVQMSLVNIVLPAPPSATESQQIERGDKKNKLSQGDLKSNEQAPAPKVASAGDAQMVMKPDAIDKYNSEPNKLQVTQRLNQLVALKGIDRTLYFPDAHTQQILAYMHNCVGIDIGAVRENNLTLFSHKNKAHSQIVRAANGFKTTQETALLAAYAPNQVLVRLYPKWFDERLGKEIANSLGNQKLTQLSGNYALRGQSLWLTDVNLNSKAIGQDWLLSQGC